MYKIFTAIKCRWLSITQFYSRASSACCLSLTLSILIVSSVHAQGVAPKITLNVTNASLENVVASIQQQSGYDFVYTANLLKTGKPVTLTISSSSINNVLDKCLSGQPFTYTITRKTVTIRPKSEPSTPTEKKDSPVSGLVTDEKNQPLPGVTIKDKQRGKVNVSDKDGHYQFSVDNEAVLVFSFVGYERLEIPRQGKTEINITMKPQNSGLNEIVVIGYGTTRKSDLTASVSTVSKEALSQRTLFSLADAIKGKAAGVQITQNDGTPGSENTIRIRGASSVSASSTPLYVIDGVMQDDANNISPGDIENIEILKDASGTAIYGSRGANGVILITTKSGKSGKVQV
ncbi:MAG TPA: TonB-dependent receptor plug domain-containing protein, partial [Mucilaginibacter sp.]|nr:TonB-dependent receptor plug domain-containing protein [Mucilaginibacter sp.]